MPRSIPEVRYSRRALAVLFVLFVVALCLCTAVSIIQTLRQQEGGASAMPAVEGQPETPDARALSDLRTLFAELRSRGEGIGRANLNRAIDVAKWDAWSVKWRERMKRFGERYNFVAAGARDGALGESLHRAYQGALKLLSAYDLAAKNLAFARTNALEVQQELDRGRSAPRP